MDIEKRIEELNKERHSRLETANDVYYDIKSPHYKDNERYSWAVKKINRIFDEEIEIINMQNNNGK